MSNHKRIELIKRSRGYPFSDLINPGQMAILTATFKDDENNITDPDTPPTVKLMDPIGKIIISNDEGARKSVGHWVYQINISNNPEVGAWTISWTATINGNTYVESQKVDVGPRPEILNQIMYGVYKSNQN